MSEIGSSKLDLLGSRSKSLESIQTIENKCASASSLRRHVAASLMQHHRAIERKNHALQPLSPASYGSSMEMSPYNPAATPNSSLDFKGRIGEPHYSLKTST
ncbi:hypothetical protein QL285_085589 [Trifolium repens]|nr:hypothetical protein QL285_085589 [Trifolium repens]